MQDFARVYDVLTQAREKLFGWVRPLSDDQYTKEFPFGLKTLRKTMNEIAAVELFYSMRLREEPNIPDWDHFPINEKDHPTFAALEKVWREQARRTRALLAETKDWDKRITRRVERPDKIIFSTASKGDLATQMLMHEVHHRAQAMAMLRQLGVEAQNLDYIGFVAERREEPVGAPR